MVYFSAGAREVPVSIRRSLLPLTFLIASSLVSSNVFAQQQISCAEAQKRFDAVETTYTNPGPRLVTRHSPWTEVQQIFGAPHLVGKDKQGSLQSGGNASGFQGDGTLSWNKPRGRAASDKYHYDPANPVPSLGGANCCGVGTTSGARDQRPIEGRADVLVYTSDYLEEEVEVIGPVKLVLHASSSAVDTDFVAKLVDVYPDGRSINVAEGILRARYRNGLSAPELLEPGQAYEMEVDMIGTANLFQKGHRIRVHVTSSHFPQFSRNLNTGEPFGTSKVMKVAEQTVYHTAERPSHILLPVIPPEK